MGSSQYSKFKNKVRQAEIKLYLSAIYTAEQSFSFEHGSYGTCLRNMGFMPSGTSRYYSVGFTGLTGNSLTCGVSGTADCSSIDFQSTAVCNKVPITGGMPLTGSDIAFSANINSPSGIPGDADLPSSSMVSRNTFKIGGTAFFQGSSDYWTIDQNRKLSNEP